MSGNTRVITVRQGEHAWSLRIIVGGEVICLYRGPDDWLESYEEAAYERKRIARMLGNIIGPVDGDGGI
jgi:hypothetical protein